jgi:hypothetical protein
MAHRLRGDRAVADAALLRSIELGHRAAVYVRDAQGALAFHALREPSGEDVAQLAAWTHAAIVRVLARHGRSLEDASDAPDAIAQEQPVLASCYGASAADVQLLGASPGQKTHKLVHPVRVVPSPTEALAEVGGVNVHAKACPELVEGS